ncbi:MAG: selenocysteine-specific translation elongation factor [Bacteroidales bacterium]|nr:selenocysteine-specific translation elongation factor [Bacteroidales bacterium]
MKHLIMGTAGHVDHGKTSLIKALTNIDCDTHKEEKERGITINLGFSHIDLPSGNSVGIIDVPGHKDFINTMVGGACGIDFVLMVIAADSGIMPQTSEHFNILKTLKVKKAIIALNKIDLVDEELAEMAKLEIMEWLEGSGFEDAPIVGVSSTTGEGLNELIKEIDQVIPQIEEKEKGNFFRMYADRLFTVKGMGSVVTGSVLNGELNMGKDVFLLPGNKQKYRVRGIQRHGETVAKVEAGDRAALNLPGLKAEDFERGMLLASKQIEETQLVDAHISLFEKADKLSLWSSVVFHSGTFISQAKMHLLNKDTVEAGEDAIVQIHLEKATVLLSKDKFVIRNTSGNKSYGGGQIIDAQPLHHRKRKPKLIEELELLASGILNDGNIAELIKIELKKEGLPLSLLEMSERLNKTTTEILEEVKVLDDVHLYNNEKVNLLIHSAVDASFYEKILNHINEHHKKNDILLQGLSENELYGKLGFTKNNDAKMYLNFLMQKMKDDGVVKAYKNTWTANDHQVNITDNTKKDIQWLEDYIKDYGFKKPVYKDILNDAEEKGISADRLKLYFKFLMIEDVFIHYQEDYLHKENVDVMRKNILKTLVKHEDGLSVKEIRDETNITKKMGPIILELFKEEGFLTISDVSRIGFKSTITQKGKEFEGMM